MNIGMNIRMKQQKNRLKKKSVTDESLSETLSHLLTVLLRTPCCLSLSEETGFDYLIAHARVCRKKA